MNLGYVVNVIEQRVERVDAIRRAWELARQCLVVSARLDWESPTAPVVPTGDGVLTAKGTFQKFFTHDELRQMVAEAVGRDPVAAAPGVFFVFRDSTQADALLASRFRQPVRQRHFAPELFAANESILQPLIAFVLDRGRLPVPSELSAAGELLDRFGSIQAAFSVVRRATGDDRWDQIVRDRQRDLLVYLALSAFGRRPRFGALPEALQRDLQSFFGSYRQACEIGNELLFSLRNLSTVDEEARGSHVGKLTPEALYVHISAVAMLSPLLRVYEGCARLVVGAVEGATVVKLHRGKARVSYLIYPEFDKEPHPALVRSFVVDLAKPSSYVKDYSSSLNPPVLHRKETFLAPSHPLRGKFAKLTAQEERAGLLADPFSIGTRTGWLSRLEQAGVQLRGHRLVKIRPSSPTD